MGQLLRYCGIGLMVGFALAVVPAKAAAPYDFENVMPAPGESELLLTTADMLYGPGESFVDTYFFDLVHPATPGPTINVAFEVHNLVDAESDVPFTVELFMHDGTSYVPLVSDGPAETVSFSHILATSTAASHVYRILVSGAAPLDATAGYVGILTVTAIPEPATVALLLAGLATLSMALAAQRRGARRMSPLRH